MDTDHCQSLPPDALSIADSPFARYLAEAGLAEEADAAIILDERDDDGETPHPSTNTIRVDREERLGWPSLTVGGGMAAIAFVGWMGWIWQRDRPAIVSKTTAGALASFAAVLAGIWTLAQQWNPRISRSDSILTANGDQSLDAAWASLDRALTSRYRYLREVDLVSRGYKLQSRALSSAWASDSFRKLDQRKHLVSCLTTVVRSAAATLGTLPTAPDLDALHEAIDKLIDDASSDYSLAPIKDLLHATRELALVVLVDAELVPPAALAAFVRGLGSVTDKLTRSDPLLVDAPSSTATTTPLAASAMRSSPVAGNLANLHAHLHTMQVKTHLALTETHDDPIALAAYLAAMPADMEYLNSLLAHLRLLADGPRSPLSDACFDGLDKSDVTITLEGSGGRVVMADEAELDRLDAEPWTGEVDLQDEGEATLRPQSKLSRQERTALRKEQMAQQAAARVAMSASLQFVGELKNVLDRRRSDSE